MKAWDHFLSNLEVELGEDAVKRWLRPLRIIRFDAANLVLEAPDPLTASWFEEHVRGLSKKRFVNENNRPIRVHLEQPKNEKKDPVPPNPTPFPSDPIDPFCTLDSFIECPDNQIALRLIRDWIRTSKPLFNPIFLFGPSKSGKTHLLMAAAAALVKAGKKVFYVSAKTFTEHVVQAIRTSRMQEFRSHYRNIDVLLVDDVDQIAGRAATQEEFFHTFNTLHTTGRQIVLTSSLPPSKLNDLEPRLISRFEWGIALGMGAPPPRSILIQKAKSFHIPLDEQLTSFLLEKFPNDPLYALQALGLRTEIKSPLSIAAAEKILADLIKQEEIKAITPERIVKNISDHFGIKSEDLTGKSQAREFALPRQVAMYVCRQKLHMPFQAIGKFFGRDHSTVMSSVKQIQLQVDAKQREVTDAVVISTK